MEMDNTMHYKYANIKLESFFSKHNINKKSSASKDRLKKQASVMNYGDVFSDEDMKNAASMVYEMVKLPKYEAIRSQLKSSSGVVNFVTNDEYPPLVEFVLKGSFSPSNNDIYHIGHVVTMPQDFVIDAKSYFGNSGGQSNQANLANNQQAVGKLQAIFKGTPKKMSTKWLKERGLSINDLGDLYGPEEAAIIKEAIQEHETILSELPKSKLAKEIEKLYATIEQDRDAKARNKKVEKENESLSWKKVLSKKPLPFPRVLSDEDLTQMRETLKIKRNLYRQRLMAAKNAHPELDIRDDFTNEIQRENDGFLSWNPAEDVRKVYNDLMSADESEEENVSEEVRTANVERAIGASLENLKIKLKAYKTSDSKLIEIRNKIFDFLSPESQQVVKFLNGYGTLTSLANEFLSRASGHGKVIMISGLENSSLTVPSEDGYSLQDSIGVFSDFVDSNDVNLEKDRSERKKTRGKRTVILISSKPLSGLPSGSKVVEMSVAPVDEAEAAIIVNHLIEPYVLEATRSSQTKQVYDVEEKYRNVYDEKSLAKREIELENVEPNLAKMRDRLGFISPEGRQSIEQMILGMGQRQAIKSVQEALASNAMYERDENEFVSNITFDEAKLVNGMIEEANKDKTRDALGLKCRRSKVKFDNYIYKTDSEWGTLVENLGYQVKDVSRINSEIQSARACIMGIDSDLMGKLSPQTKKAKLEEREGWMKEIENLTSQKLGVMKDIPHFTILWGSAGVGKCLGRGTPVMMFDGNIKNAEDVSVGDLLMGPDSKPRTVLSTTSGVGPLYRVDQKNGEPYVCNNAHILSLQNTNKPYEQNPVFISAEEYCKKDKAWKHDHKGWKAGVEFESQDLPIDPYWIGLWLGDGVSRIPSIMVSDKDVEIAEWLEKWSKEQNLFIRKEKQRGCSAWHFTDMQGSDSGCTSNKIKTKLRDLCLLKNKHIPDIYYKNSSLNRLNLLAGLIDSDGYKTKTGCVQFTNVNKKLAMDVLKLARSVGIRASFSEGIKGIKELNYTVKAYTITMGGALSKIPSRLKRKQGHDNPQKKSTRYGIDVTPIGEGEYFGFTIDGDRQFLLGDFTVTHNSVWGDALADLCGFMIYNVRLSEVKDKWVGNTGKFTTNLLNTIFASRNAIYLVDEIDRMMQMSHGSSGEGGTDTAHETTKDMVSQFLEYFEDRKNDLITRNIFVVMTTNNLNSIDTALMKRTRGDTYRVEAADAPEDYLKYLNTFLQTERKDSPDDPWIRAEGDTDSQRWDYTMKYITKELDLQAIAQAFSSKNLPFRDLSGMLRKACRHHNSYLNSLNGVSRGDKPKFWGLPMTTQNIINAAAIANDGSGSNTEYSSGIDTVLRDANSKVNKIMENVEFAEETVSHPITGQPIKRFKAPQQIIDILNGSAEEDLGSKFMVDEEEVIDPLDLSKKRKRVLRQEPNQTNQPSQPNKEPSSIKDLPENGMVEKGVEEVPQEKENSDENLGKENAKEKKKTTKVTSTDYLFDFLEKRGFFKKEAKNEVDGQYDSVEKNGVYYFEDGQVVIAPSNSLVAKQNPQRLNFKQKGTK